VHSITCRSRCCPKCQAQARKLWLQAQQRDLLNTNYFHLVFTLPHELNPQEYRIVHPDGGIRDIHAVGHAVLGRSGELVEFVGTVIDVTERKRAEEELKQLVDLVPQVILVHRPDGKWIHANRVAVEYTGLTLDEYRSVDLVGRTIHPGDAEKMRVVRERGFFGSDPFELEARQLG
jgi:PAS domain-containing protein